MQKAEPYKRYCPITQGWCKGSQCMLSITAQSGHVLCALTFPVLDTNLFKTTAFTAASFEEQQDQLWQQSREQKQAQALEQTIKDQDEAMQAFVARRRVQGSNEVV